MASITVEISSEVRVELNRIEKEASEQARVCVPGGLIVNEKGQVFVQRRVKDRRLFPGCWDIVGGHCEPSESILETLEREVLEETGWKLRSVEKVVATSDWESEDNGELVKKKDIACLITVEGDLSSPLLEQDKHDKFAWVGKGDLEILRQNRDEVDDYIYELVKKVIK